MYTAKVIEIGFYVEALLNENMVVLFGPTAPAELKDICVIHDAEPTEEAPVVQNGTLLIGNQEYKVEEYGEAANTNLAGLGHLTIMFSQEGELLPGSVRVTPSKKPIITVGTIISFQG